MNLIIWFVRLSCFAGLAASAVLFGLRVGGCISIELPAVFSPLVLPLALACVLCLWFGLLDAANLTGRYVRRVDRVANLANRPSRSERRRRRVRR